LSRGEVDRKREDDLVGAPGRDRVIERLRAVVPFDRSHVPLGLQYAYHVVAGVED